MEFVEIEPVEYKKNEITVWKYSQINTYCIDVYGGARGLKDRFNSLIPTNGHWEIEEDNGYYYAAYVKSN